MTLTKTVSIAVAGSLLTLVALAQPAAPDARTRAVRTTAQRASSCRALGDFYWEIGNRDRPLASGQVGRQFSGDSAIAIASASKWVFGAYVLQRIGRPPSPGEIEALSMRSGYVSFRPLLCALAGTVQGCFDRGDNSAFTGADVGKFSYGGGHDQKLAIDMGLGGLTRQGLATEVRRVLGNDLDFSYATPDLAGGLRASPTSYGRFLRKILRGDLRISGYLGTPTFCTLPDACSDAVHSPIDLAWHYGLNYWIEDDPAGDGAFSSAGAFGFYPWITADRGTYGLLARHSFAHDAAEASAICGQHLRRAWASGRAQLD